jgi:hypothetical protein
MGGAGFQMARPAFFDESLDLRLESFPAKLLRVIAKLL